MPTRKNISFLQQVLIDRRYNEYDYGGNWLPLPVANKTGTDCSGAVVDSIDGTLNGTAMAWTRHGLSTEDWRPPSMGGNADPTNGPFGSVMVDSPDDYPADAAVLLAFHHGPGGGENSHTWCQIDQLKQETHGSDGTYPNGATVLNDGVNFLDVVLDVHTVDSPSTYGANSWWYIPGPIVEDGTPVPTGPSWAAAGPPAAPATLAEAPDTLWADVSEFQAPADASYWASTYPDGGQNWNYRWLSIRSNDGDHVDLNFAANYAECVRACNAGEADGFFVYYFWHPGSDAVNNHMALVKAQGGPHPNMISMIDLETGDGNAATDESSQLDNDYFALGAWLGDQRRVIGYANVSDEKTLWQTKPVANLPMDLAGYGSNPTDDTVYKFAHQYTNGQGYGGGLPEGAGPWAACDMNSADGLTTTQLANILGVGASTPIPGPPPPPPAFTYPSQADMVTQLWEQAFGPQATGWPTEFGQTADGSRGKFTVEAIGDLHAAIPPAPVAKTASKPRKGAAK